VVLKLLSLARSLLDGALRRKTPFAC